MSDTAQNLDQGGNGTQPSPIVTLLLQITGRRTRTAEEEVNPPQEETWSGDAALRKQEFKRDVESHYASPPSGAAAGRVERLKTLRQGFYSALAGNPATQEKALANAYADLVQEHRAAEQEVKDIRAKRKALLEELDKALAAGAPKHVQDGASEDEAAPLFVERARLATLLAAPGDDKPEVPPESFTPIGEGIEALTDAVEEFRKRIAAREAARKQLREALEAVIPASVTKPADVVPGAVESEARPLVDERDRIAKVLTDAKDITAISPEGARISALEQGREALAATVAARLIRKQEIEREAVEIAKALDKDADPEALDWTREKIAKALAATPLTDDALKAADDELPTLRSDVAEAKQDVIDRKESRAALREQLNATLTLIEKNCSQYDLKAVEGVLAEIGRTLDGHLHEIDFDELAQKLGTARYELDEAMIKVAKSSNRRKPPIPVDYLKAAFLAISTEGTALAGMLGDGDLTERIEEDGKAFDGLMKNTHQENLLKAFDLVATLRADVNRVREEQAQALERNARQRTRILGALDAADPKGLPDGFTKLLEADRRAVKDLLGDQMSPDIDDDVISKARQALLTFEKDLADAETFAKAWAAIEKEFASVRANARDTVKAELDRRQAEVVAASIHPATARTLARATALCEPLARLLASAKSEQGKAQGAKGKLSGVKVRGEALESATVDAVYDAIGPDALDALGDEALGKLCDCFHKASGADLAALRALAGEGLGGEGKVLAGLVRSGDKDAILAFARGFGGDGAKEDRARLRGLVLKGGLDAAPTVLDDMLSYGVSGAGNKDQQRAENVGQLKALCTAFDGTEGQERMKQLTADCGLGQPRRETPPRPGVLAELLQGAAGFGGDATKLRGFADQYAGDGATAKEQRAQLKGLIDGGGFAARPKAFAPLVGSLTAGGKMDSGVKVLKEVGASFKDPTDQAKLKTILEEGGISGDTDLPGRQHEHPDTLAKVFTDGLGNRAADLRSFARSFGDSNTHAQECHDMMEAWNEFPNNHAAHRQPGKKVALLLDGPFAGDVRRLQTQFTTNLKRVPVINRKQATRFGPHFQQENARNKPLPQPNVDPGKGVNQVRMASILERHVPRYAKRSRLDAQNSYFPVDFDENSLKQTIEAAMADPGAPLAGAPAASLPGGNGLTVHIAHSADGNIPHCYPSNGPAPPDPGEIASFSFAESTAILDAVDP